MKLFYTLGLLLFLSTPISDARNQEIGIADSKKMVATTSKSQSQVEAITDISHGGGPNFSFMKGHWTGKSGNLRINEWWLTGLDEETMCLQRSFEGTKESITLTSITSYKGAPMVYSRTFDSKLYSDKESDFMWTRPSENNFPAPMQSAVMIIKTSSSSDEWKPAIKYELLDKTRAVKSVFNQDNTISRFELSKVD